MIVVNAFEAEAALADALARRMRGERFEVRFQLLDDATAIAAATIGALVQTYPHGPQRRAALDALGAKILVIAGKPVRALTSRSPAQRAAMAEIAQLAYRVVVHSHAEADALVSLLGTRRERLRIVPPNASKLADIDSSALGDALLVAAQGVHRDVAALVVHALDEEHIRRVFIGDPDAARDATVQQTNDVAAAVRSARAIVVVSPYDARDALAFVSSARPLAVAATSGAREYLAPVAVFDPWDPRSIRTAANDALHLAAPTLQALPSARERAAAVASHPPLVSIVVRTRDRPNFLARALASIRAQTYRNVETIVVVDGGCSVSHILAEHPGVRSIVHAAPMGPVRALDAGMRAATGAYLGILDDDDRLFPDHLERLVGALLAGSGRVAQSIATTLFARAEGSSYRVYGIATFLRRVARPDRIYLEHGAAPMALLVRRDAFEESGGIDTQLEHAEDWDLLIRLTQHDDVVFVPEVTAAYTVRPEESSSQVQSGHARIIEAQKYLNEKYPLPERPRIVEARENLYARTVQSGGVAHFPAHVPIDGGLLW